MKDIIQLNNEIYIKASSSLADQRLRVLKHGEVFGIFDVFGDIKPVGIGAQGLYNGATRFLSQMELRVGGRYPTLLSSTITSDDMLFIADLSNPDLECSDGGVIPQSSVHFSRTKILFDGSCYEELEITNFRNSGCVVPLAYAYKTDFVDMFEIRGLQREQRGELLPVVCGKDNVLFRYHGLDGKMRSCRIFFHTPPRRIDEFAASFEITLTPRQTQQLFVTVECAEGDLTEERRRPKYFLDVFQKYSHSHDAEEDESCHIQSSSERFALWLERSKADIQLMTTTGSHGSYPYAGIPWFNTVFGRDGLITALQYLWVDPMLARNVLACLANLQAKEDNAFEDAEPGKILHELRNGEMVDTGAVPFKRYYGSADATPLFIIVAGKYLEMTADLGFAEKIWPSIQAALRWIDRHGDLDGDGFVEYLRRSPKGLDNQGWKDSADSVSHANGNLAEGSIALCEVQGYAYDAKRQAAYIAEKLGIHDLPEKLWAEAEQLRENFQKKFWSGKLDSFALALDGRKKPCEVLASNAGHCLFSGIADQEQALKVSKKLLSEEMFSGWGVRTLSSKEERYNPMSYHNGSVWPHDNALIADGFDRYALKEETLRVAEAFFDVARNIDLYRLPELFCGFRRRGGQGPTLYPVACSPQAWAAGSVFMFLKACLGLRIDGFSKIVSFSRPVLPYAITDLRLNNLRAGSDAQVDLLFKRYGSEVNVYVERRVGKVEVNILK